MASTQATNTRKRSLLRTFGSRRRHKEFSISLSVSSDATRPTNPILEVETASTPNAHRRDSKHLYSQDKAPMAVDQVSRDDGAKTRGTQEGNMSNSSERLLRTGTNCAAHIRNQQASPFEMHPIVMSTYDALMETPESSNLERSSLKTPPLSQASRHNRRYTTSSVQIEKTSELLSLLGDSTVFMDDSLLLGDEERQNVRIPPIPALEEQIAGQRSSSLKALDGVHVVSAEQINDKVRGMLAAMDALKPSTPRKSHGSQKLSRMASSKVFSRMSGVLGRMYSKSPSPEGSSNTQQSRVGLRGTGIPLTKSSSHANESQYSIRSIEIRLNEGTNLNRSKVQQIVGHKVFRKPIPSKKGSLLCSTFDDAANEASSSAPSGVSEMEGCLSSVSPFDTEEDFESNLDKGILNGSPAGSSTPRIRVHRTSGSTFGDGCAEDLTGSSIGQVNLARVVKFNTKGVGSPRLRQVKVQTPTNAKESALYPRQRPKREGSVQYADFGIVKKHPSPSKRDLEELEIAFQQYAFHKGPQVYDDADELAAGNTLWAEALAVRDPNCKMRNGSRQTQNTKAQQNSYRKAFSSRIPRPLSQVKARKSTELRLAVECRPKNAVPGEADELS